MELWEQIFLFFFFLRVYCSDYNVELWEEENGLIPELWHFWSWFKSLIQLVLKNITRLEWNYVFPDQPILPVVHVAYVCTKCLLFSVQILDIPFASMLPWSGILVECTGFSLEAVWWNGNTPDVCLKLMCSVIAGSLPLPNGTNHRRALSLC